MHPVSHLQVPQQKDKWLGIPAIRYTTIQSGVRGHGVFRIIAMGDWCMWRGWLLHIHTLLSMCSLDATENRLVNQHVLAVRMYFGTKSIVQM